MDFLRITKAMDAKLKEITKKSKEESSASSDADKIDASVMSVATDSPDTRTVSPNEKQTLLQKDVNDAQHGTDSRTKSCKDLAESEIISTDLLEDFESPILLIKKQLLEEKSQDMQCSTAVPSEVKSDEQQSASEDKEAKPKSCRVKHINDEL